MVKCRPNYSKEFKLRICRELQSGATVAELSRKHQVHPRLMYRWVTEYRRDAAGAFPSGSGQKDPGTASDSAEARIAELERLVGQLTLENEFLKRTLRAVETTFGRVPPKDGTR
jgi:transposase-like protein